MLCGFPLFAEDDKDAIKEEPPEIGNFAFPASQQPGALFGFGGNIIDKDQVQFYFFADELVGGRVMTIDLIPSMVYGITDDFSIFLNTPFTPYLKYNDHHSSGLEDFFIQLEYAFYNEKTSDYTDQATVLGNVTFPTGSARKQPPTGFGSNSYFVGTTFCRTYVNWVLFTAHGAILPTQNHGSKLGNQFLYQFGCARNFASPPGWIYAGLLEVDGQYNCKNRLRDRHKDPNSGGNTIYVTPSLWMSTKELLIQFGVSFPVTQHLFGHQNKYDYVLNFNIAWSLY